MTVCWGNGEAGYFERYFCFFCHQLSSLLHPLIIYSVIGYAHRNHFPTPD
jgi:hypothetical protein